MNLKKITAGAVASAIAVSALAISTSADHLYQPTDETSPYLTTDGGNWLYRIYNAEESEAEGPAVSRDFDPWDIAKISLYAEMTVADDSEWTVEDFDESIDGSFSGCIIYSANGGDFGSGTFNSPTLIDENGEETTYYGKYNWPNSGVEFWALPPKGDSYEGRPTEQGGTGTNTGYVDYTKPVVAEYIKQYNYVFNWDVPDDMRWPEEPLAGLYRVGYAAWSDNSGIFKMKINLMICRDDNGEILLAVDYLGNEITGEEAEALVAQWIEEGENEVLDSDEPSDDGSDDSSEPADDGSDDSSEPASGDTPDDGDSEGTTTTPDSSSSSSSANSSMPIIIGVIIAVVVVVVIVVIVIIVVVSKKKKS